WHLSTATANAPSSPGEAMRSGENPKIMRNNIKWWQCTVVIVLLLIVQLAQAQQKGIRFDLSSGAAIAGNQFHQDTPLFSNGLQSGGSLAYLGKHLGIEFHGGSFKNPLHADL